MTRSSFPEYFELSLPTGVLTLDVIDSCFPARDLLGFAARANPKRAFLFLSKVLGKHYPVRPSFMLETHRALAQRIPALPQPVIFIGMAETATGLGHGVFEAWIKNNPDAQAVFVQTTRYGVEGADLIEFEEAHSHAPRVFLHQPSDEPARTLFTSARSLVLIDDEISTGNTFVNLAHACRRSARLLETVHLTAIADFSNHATRHERSERFGLPCTSGSLMNGQWTFEGEAIDGAGLMPAQRASGQDIQVAKNTFGRIGRIEPLSLPKALIARLINDISSQDTVLVLGTGEFMHASFLLGLELENQGLNVRVQATTRSPILLWGDVQNILSFQDNYGEGLGNYLYNVMPGQYDHVLICHETPPDTPLFDLARLCAVQAEGKEALSTVRLIHFHSEVCIEEIPVC